MTPDEVLDHIYEHMDNELGISFYDPLNGNPAELYITTPQGQCYQIVAKEHPHGRQED